MLIYRYFPAIAQDTIDLESLISIPPKTNGPVEVLFNLLDLELLNVNEVEETWEIRVELSTIWKDKQLRFNPELFGYNRKIFNDKAALNKTDRIWIPKINLRDQRGKREIIKTSLIINSDGLVELKEEFRIFIKSIQNLEDFPFDKHVLKLVFTSFVHDTNEVIFKAPDDTNLDIARERRDFYLRDFKILTTFEPNPENPEQEFATIQYILDIERIPFYYLWKSIIPLFIFVAITWTIFWIEMPWHVRVSITIVSLLTIVAFQISVSKDLPKISYSTVLDRLILLSIIFVGVNILETAVTHKLTKADKQLLAKKIDQIARWLFPLVYILLVIFIIFV